MRLGMRYFNSFFLIPFLKRSLVQKKKREHLLFDTCVFCLEFVVRIFSICVLCSIVDKPVSLSRVRLIYFCVHWVRERHWINGFSMVWIVPIFSRGMATAIGLKLGGGRTPKFFVVSSSFVSFSNTSLSLFPKLVSFFSSHRNPFPTKAG